jgi:hypothetical protein
LRRDAANHYAVTASDLAVVPGSPISYWATSAEKGLFEFSALKKVAAFKEGLTTANNELFLRFWSEVDFCDIRIRTQELEREVLWVPYNKGGPFRRWYGNNDYVVDWRGGGDRIRAYPGSSFRNASFQLKEGATFSALSSSGFAVRYCEGGFAFDSKGTMLFSPDELQGVVSYLNSHTCARLIGLVAPTLDYRFGTIQELPYLKNESACFEPLVAGHRADWDAYERSWDFQSLPLLTASSDSTPILESSYTAWITQNRDTIAKMKRLEEENNRLFIDAYGLADELTPDVPLSQITLTVNPAYRFGGKLTEEELWTRFRQDTMEELVSYSIGCMMGRYSLDAPGLIYAHSGNEGFDPSRYSSFPADDDGIVPLTDTEWFEDDAAQRVIKFISVAWDAAHLSDNLAFLAENLSPKRNESNHETIRRYLCDSFYKDHMQTYKKRPIYWLFSSGKQKAFQCLVYLHRYNEGTLARMRTEYVTPLTGKYAVHAEQLERQIEGADSTAEANRLKKELTALEKQLVELREFDAKLKHFADRRISLDLDDGVKHNYGKFGDLLAEVKTITGEAPEKI